MPEANTTTPTNHTIQKPVITDKQIQSKEIYQSSNRHDNMC